MPVFRCFIRGEYFPGSLLGQEDPVGFYATRFVEADSREQAELSALELLRHAPELDVAPEFRTQDTKVYFEEIDEVLVEPEQESGAGFTYFTMGS